MSKRRKCKKKWKDGKSRKIKKNVKKAKMITRKKSKKWEINKS